MAKFQSLLALLALVPVLVRAQQTVWGQCGGIGWTGATTCASGSVCTEQNAYYSQCLPSSAVPSSAPPTTAPTTAPPTKTSPTTTSPTNSAPSSTATPAPGNPFTGFEWYLSPYYASEVSAAAAQMTGSAAQQAASVANIPTFIWFDQVAKVPQLSTYLADASAQQTSTGQKLIVPIVVYDLPDRDCAAAASNGEFTIQDNGQANYENYIDQIAAAVAQYPDVRVVAIIEPDSLANLVTNLSVAECSAAETTYKTCITYALQQLAAVGVYMYMDAGHAGWLGWPANLSPAAELFAQMYVAGGSSPFIRGLATNVANYNALVAATPDPITQGNPNYDEQLYINALAPMLQQQGFSAQFVVEQARSGVQNIRQQWGDWCNVKGAGFGTQPTTNTGNSLIDAIVWVKPGGESDGTSNTSAARYDYHCGLSDADQPSPEAGTWFQEYFQTLVSQANPPIPA